MKRLLIIAALIMLAAALIACDQETVPPLVPTTEPSPEIELPPPPAGQTAPPEGEIAPTISPAPALTPAPPRGPIYIDAGNTIITDVDDGFSIGLHVVLRLGARWQVDYDDDMLTLVINDLYIDDDPSNPGLGGTQYFRFRAIKAGATQIECSLKHGTTGPVSEQKTFSIQIEGG